MGKKEKKDIYIFLSLKIMSSEIRKIEASKLKLACGKDSNKNEL